VDFLFFFVIFTIGFMGSYVSGMVGIGGSVIKYPMLLYIPPLLGIVTFTAHEISGINAVQVFFASMSSVWAYRKSGFLNKEVILYMGLSMLMGGLVGSFTSDILSEGIINIVYAILATLAVLLMLLPKSKDQTDSEWESVKFNKVLATTISLLVGIFAGIIGAAGAFLLVPIMIVILGIPTRIAIASSLAITFISSIGTTFGKVITGQVLLVPAIVMIVASFIAAPLGVTKAKQMNVMILQWILAILIFLSAVKIWSDLLF